jgi:UPF0716 protein FxsA
MGMRRNWPVLFIVVPLLELYLIIEVGSRIGAMWTVFIVIMTAIVGVQLLRIQGVNTLMRAQQNMKQGTMPAMEMMEGILLAVGGALLITPGFITDTLGFLCLIPVTRRAMINAFIARSGGMVGSFHVSSHDNLGAHHREDHQTPSDDGKAERTGSTIEGEFHHKDQ